MLNPLLLEKGIRSRQVTTLAFQPGAVLCMFTDGLVERRYEPIGDGITGCAGR